MHYITIELLFVTWAGISYLFLTTENFFEVTQGKIGVIFSCSFKSNALLY